MKPEKTLDAICKNCIFAEYDGDTQTGCAFNIIDKVKRYTDKEVLEAYDEEKNFYVIKDFVCPYQRGKVWQDSREDNNYKEIAESEVYMKWSAFLWVNQSSIREVKSYIGQLMSQDVPPSAIVVICNFDPEKIDTLLPWMQNLNIKWFVQNTKDISLNRTHIDIAFDKLRQHKYRFYCVFDINHPTKHIYRLIHDYVFDKLQPFFIVKDPDSLHQMIVNKIVHLKYAGNSGGHTLEKKVKADNGKGYVISHRDLHKW